MATTPESNTPKPTTRHTPTSRNNPIERKRMSDAGIEGVRLVF